MVSRSETRIEYQVDPYGMNYIPMGSLCQQGPNDPPDRSLRDGGRSQRDGVRPGLLHRPDPRSHQQSARQFVTPIRDSIAKTI